MCLKNFGCFEDKLGINGFEQDIKLPIIPKVKEEHHRLTDFQGDVLYQDSGGGELLLHVWVVNLYESAKAIWIAELIQMIITETNG